MNQSLYKVLIVDDVEDMVAFMIEDISRLIEGVVFEKAYAAGPAIEKFNEFKPGIILLDIGLGLSSGFDVLRHVRKNNANTKVIVVTNFTDSFFRIKSEDLGADFYIDKSKEFQKIPSIILSIIKEGNMADTLEN